MTEHASFSTIYQNQDNLHISQDAQTVAEIALTGDVILEETGWSREKNK